MSPASPVRPRHHLPITGAAVGLIACLALVGVGLSSPADAAVTKVPLGKTVPFAVLAGQGITNTGATTITGDIGSFPNGAIDDTTIVLTGTNHGNDNVTQDAKQNLVTAYNEAEAAPDGATPPASAPPNIGNQTLTAGAYNRGATMNLTGTLTLDAENDPNAVFIFQAGADLIVAPNAVVRLTRGAQACNVFWQVTSSATIDTNARFVGNVLALTSIFANTGARIEGRLLARNGEVTLQNNTITRPSCATGVPRADVVVTPKPSPVATSKSPSSSSTAGTDGTSGDDEDESGDDSGTSGSTSGGDSGTESGSTSGTTSTDRTTSTGQTTSIPNTGGPSGVLLPLGLATTAAGVAVVVLARKRPRGAHRA